MFIMRAFATFHQLSTSHCNIWVAKATLCSLVQSTTTKILVISSNQVWAFKCIVLLEKYEVSTCHRSGGRGWAKMLVISSISDFWWRLSKYGCLSIVIHNVVVNACCCCIIFSQHSSLACPPRALPRDLWFGSIWFRISNTNFKLIKLSTQWIDNWNI